MTTEDFASFFVEIHGYAPFRWQARLLSQVLSGQGWPQVIARPTAAGKTAIIDIAVFALAAEAAVRTSPRRAPRRIFFIIDRRIVVDQAYERATRIAEKLDAARTGILGQVSQALLSLGGEVPLAVARLRGGMYLDRAWVRSPAQPVVCVSTVDQVGSRLLFRGYGLQSQPRNTLPIQAGLIGNDALLVLDEAHLSRPCAETFASLARYRQWGEEAPETPWHVVEMTATPRGRAPATFGSRAEDHEDDLRDPVLQRRLNSRKRARLAKAVPSEKGEEAKNRALLVEALASELVALQEGGARIVGGVVNRVATARGVFERLRHEREAALLIGPCRPFDRDALLERYLPRIGAGRDRRPEDPPLILLATQAIEVGADIDLDALATECAPLDSLRQRFGRLDRLGELGEAQAAIVIRKDHAAKSWSDPIYGNALSETWSWLKEHAGRPKTIEMGHAGLAPVLPTGDKLEKLCSPSPSAPVLLPAHLDLLAQTSPIPVPDPDVSLFLHGPRDSAPDVQVVWRADLPEDPKAWVDIVALAPPASPEALPISWSALRAWLVGGPLVEEVDVEGTPAAPDGIDAKQGISRPVLRWRGPEASEVTFPADIRPGDTIVVPCTYGGADEFGWNPAETNAVHDVADPVSLRYRGRALLRIHPALATEGVVGARALAARLDAGVLDLEQDLLEPLARSENGEVAAAARALLQDSRPRVALYPNRTGIVIRASRAIPVDRIAESAETVSDEDDGASFTRRVSLDDHSGGVTEWVSRFATACRLPNEIAQDLGTAARLHDLGKLDRRFQIFLHGGDRIASAIAETPLAKSGLNLRGTAFRNARARSGYPRGYCHETASAALAEEALNASTGTFDGELILHLISSHHGCGRPFLPPVTDPDPVTLRATVEGREVEISSAHGLERVDSGVSDRFWRLIESYGWYGLAYLEAILRLADHRRSAEEEQREA